MVRLPKCILYKPMMVQTYIKFNLVGSGFILG
jgi:hypothetical protein